MNDKKRPAFRLKFRDKNKQTFDVGVCWPGRFPDSFDVSPQLVDENGRYPKMSLENALRRVANKDGWLSLVSAEAKKQQPQPGNGGGFGDGPSDFTDDSDLPF